MASSSNSPCAACKFLRRKCAPECVFSPYFPPEHPEKFSNVHKVFGASNVAKLLNDLNPTQREEAVNSLAYEAEARLRDPVYGCVGYISILQQKLKQIQHDLFQAKKELAAYIGPSAMLPLSHPHSILNQVHSSNAMAAAAPYALPSVGLGVPAAPATPSQAQLLIRDQQILETQQLAAAFAARGQQEMMRNYVQQQQQQQQQEMGRFNSGFDGGGGGAATAGFNQMNAASPSSIALAASPSSMSLVPFDSTFQAQQQEQEQQLQHQQHRHHHQQQHAHQPHHQRTGSEECRSVDPSS